MEEMEPLEMTTWILLILALSPLGEGISVTSVKFDNQRACQKASDWFRDTTTRVRTVCIEDGKALEGKK